MATFVEKKKLFLSSFKDSQNLKGARKKIIVSDKVSIERLVRGALNRSGGRRNLHKCVGHRRLCAVVSC